MYRLHRIIGRILRAVEKGIELLRLSALLCIGITFLIILAIVLYFDGAFAADTRKTYHKSRSTISTYMPFTVPDSVCLPAIKGTAGVGTCDRLLWFAGTIKGEVKLPMIRHERVIPAHHHSLGSKWQRLRQSIEQYIAIQVNVFCNDFIKSCYVVRRHVCGASKNFFKGALAGSLCFGIMGAAL